MLSLLFSLAASVSAQSVTSRASRPVPTRTPVLTPGSSNLPPACQAKIEKNTALAVCGPALNSTVTAGALPGLPSVENLNNNLDAFCSTGCSAAFLTLADDLTSPECSEAFSNAANMQINSKDIGVILKTFGQAACVKDGDQYCASEIFSLAIAGGSQSADAILNNQTVICSKCVRLETEILTTGIAALSTVDIKNQIQTAITPFTDAQAKCPSSNSAFKSAVLPVVAIAMALALF